MNNIITISRQFSSGGREISLKLAEALDYAYYDKQLIQAVAEETGYVAEFIEKYSEASVTRSYPFAFGRSFAMYQQTPIEQIQIAQTNIIKELGNKGNAVFVGRCADQILSDLNPFKVFIYSSDIGARIERCYEQVPTDREKGDKEMRKMIQKIDKERASYYEFVSSGEWGVVSNYNLCIDTAFFSTEQAVELLLCAVKGR